VRAVSVAGFLKEALSTSTFRLLERAGHRGLFWNREEGEMLYMKFYEEPAVVKAS